MPSSSSAPLNQRIQRILLDRHGEPITLLELQQMLRRMGQAVHLERLRDLLSDRRTYTALSEDRFVLRDHFTTPVSEPPTQQGSATFIQNLPQAHDSYVVLDIETTGLNAEQDQMIQIAALRVLDQRPVSFQSWYFWCPPERLTPSLRRTLHLTDDLMAQIAAAPQLQASWPEVRAFLGESTLVIHNARFDTSFLLQTDPELPNRVVDTMELAVLLLPHASQHSLNQLARSLGVAVDSLDTCNIAGVPPGYHPSEETLHNAITDVLLLAAVYRALLERWRALEPDLQSLLVGILPEAWGSGAPTPRRLDTVARWPVAGQQMPQVVSDADPQSLLDRLAAQAGLAPRASQRVMVTLISDALANDHSVLVEAPTGTGKTLGYLVPSVWSALAQGRRIALATAFKNLQDQLRDEVVRLQRVTPFRAQVLKGASSYLCLRELQQAIDEIDADTNIDRRLALAVLSVWTSLAPSATLDELTFWLSQALPVTRELVRTVAVDRATCTGTQCPFFADCRYFGAYAQGAQADVLLINQALWLADPGLLPPFDALIIDEAHNLEDVATSAWEVEVSEASLTHQLRRLIAPSGRGGILRRILDLRPDEQLQTAVRHARQAAGQALQLVTEFRATLAAFVQGCDERLTPETGAQLRLTGAPARIYPTRWGAVQQALDQIWQVYLTPLVSSLQTIEALLPASELVLARTVAAVREAFVEQQALLSGILQARHSDLVTWIAVCTDPVRAGWGFHAAPINVAPLLAERYRRLRSVALTSATLTTGPNNFSFFVERLGLRDALAGGQITSLSGVLPYGENVVLGLPTYLTYTPAQTTIESFVQELADELTLLFQLTDGRALTLFTARSRLNAVWQRNAGPLEAHGIPVLAQYDGESRQRLIAQFREHGGAVLYGLKSFWEGIDVPGAALSFVVMEKLPYPALTDPVHAARREAVARRSGREFQDYLFPLMVIQFKQGYGRLIRQPDDRGAVILYDRRIVRKSYLPELLGALPGFQPRDPHAERGRRSFYTLLAERLPDVIDHDTKRAFIDDLPDTLLTDLEALLERCALPATVSDAEYDAWRPAIREALLAIYGFSDFRSPEQEAAFRAVLTGRDVVAVLPTGAGKSLAFQLPALLRHGVTVVCSPLIALMRDQIDKLQDRGIEVAAALMSGQNAAEREEILGRVRAGRVRLLYLAPERLRDPAIRLLLTEANIRQIVVDEAHCVALWGPSFRPDFLVLPQIYDALPQRPPVAAFTATATPAITNAIVDGLALAEPCIVRASVDRPELHLAVLDNRARYHAMSSKTDQIRRLLLLVQTADQRGEAMLVYVATTNEAENIARLLQVAGYAARAYHGRMPVQERANVGELFMEGLISIVVCTKAFGMGIDKPDIRYVVHFHVPGDLESYFQEVGRAGRDGQLAYGVLLYHPSDERIQQYFIDQSRPDTVLLIELWRWIGEQPTQFVLDPAAASDQFDIDELGLRRAIYLLERAGRISRGPDETLSASLTLLGDWEEMRAATPPSALDVLAQLQAALPDAAWSPQTIHVTDLAATLGIAAHELDRLLIALSVSGACLYRPWERGYQIRRLVDAGAPLPSIDGDTVALQQEKLARMRAFVRGQACRWQVLRQYFGEHEGQPCGRCDRCNPEQRYPWSGKTGRDVPETHDFLDLATTLLEIVDWNERRSSHGHAPFGTRSLTRILRGEEYALMRHAPRGPAADARRRTLRECPYWGVCRTLRRSTRELDHLLGRLVAEGYVAASQAPAAGGSYEYLALTERGRTQLHSGDRLNWFTPSTRA